MFSRWLLTNKLIYVLFHSRITEITILCSLSLKYCQVTMHKCQVSVYSYCKTAPIQAFDDCEGMTCPCLVVSATGVWKGTKWKSRHTGTSVMDGNWGKDEWHGMDTEQTFPGLGWAGGEENAPTFESEWCSQCKSLILYWCLDFWCERSLTWWSLDLASMQLECVLECKSLFILSAFFFLTVCFCSLISLFFWGSIFFDQLSFFWSFFFF